MSLVQRASAAAPWAVMALSAQVGVAPPSPASVETLLEKLRSPAGSDRMGAACQLGRTRDPRALLPLVEVLEGSAPPGVRTCAASSLGDLGVPGAIEPLLRALDDPDRMVSAMVAYALGAYAEPRVLARLVDALNRHREPNTRSATAGGLARARDPSAVEPLVRILREGRDSDVRTYVAQALGAFSGRPEATDALISCLESDSEYSVRDRAARALGRLKDPKARGALEKAAREDDNPQVRKAASMALEGIGSKAPPP